jgi:integral membrane protein
MSANSILKILRVVAILEGISYLLLFITMPLKRLYAMPAPNYIVGMAHGVLFISYVLLVFIASRQQKWSLKTQFYAYIASLIPFGTFVADKKIFKLK